MRLRHISWECYRIPMQTGKSPFREGILLQMMNEAGDVSIGEIAPLPGWSQETVGEALKQLEQRKKAFLEMEWKEDSWKESLQSLNLYPSVLFGVESAVLSLLLPLPPFKIEESALLMGNPQDIMTQAFLRKNEGYISAKLKIRNLLFEEAKAVIDQLKDVFHLRIDVNRAWSTQNSLRFFSQYPLDTFEYVEEPFSDPHDLMLFPHPLAVDESFPTAISLDFLDALPTLKALIYKPTLQGGLTGCLPLHEWTQSRGISLVMSSSFETDVGLAHVASIAKRLSLTAPVGLGTRHF